MLNPETETDIGDLNKTSLTNNLIDTITTSNNDTNLTINQQQNNKNPLNDHDYCSPNKMTTPQQLPNKQIENQFASNKDTNLYDNATITNANSNTNNLNSVATLSNDLDDKQKAQVAKFKPFPNPDGDDFSDSSLSSSSSSIESSVTSNSNLAIVQDHDFQKLKNIPQQSTQAVKRKPGRPPKRDYLVEDGSSQDSSTRIKRERQPRQSTSVTDKSQWITGEDALDSALSEHLLDRKPRERRSNSGIKEPDPAFSQYTSSEYSSSDAESDDHDDNSEDDPDRLWCICQKPHDGKFMICCDVCKDWFHGHCVGVTKLMGDRFEKQGKEWFCAECHEKIRSGIPRSAIPNKIVKKEKKKSKSSSGKRGRGRPRKSESSMNVSTRSLRSSRKPSSSLDPKLGVDNGRVKKNLARADVRSESFDEFQDSQKLKELIRERKKAFFYKRQLAAQQKAARRGELGLPPKQSITANLSDSLDSLATSTSTPNMNNLPINIKEKLKPNIVLQINMKKDPNSDQNNSSSRIVTTIVKSPKKKIDTNNPNVNDLFSADPIQINKKIIIKPPIDTQATESTSKITFQPTSSGDTTKSSNQSNNGSNGDTSNVKKVSNPNNLTIKKEKHKIDGEQGPSSIKKKRKDSESSLTNGTTSSGGSQYFINKIKEVLETRCSQFPDFDISIEKIGKIATDIESKLNEFFKEGTPKYRNKFASIIFNLKDPKNQALAKNVLAEAIEPARLVNMSPDELASSELAKWRERENKHSIELIKRDAELAAQQVIVKKTHKGEEVIAAPSANEPDDPTAAKDTQDTPITPNKLSNKEPPPRVDGTKITLTPPSIKPPTIKPIEYDLSIAEDEEQHPLYGSLDSDKPLPDYSTSSGYIPGEQCWSGTIYTPDVGKFSAIAKSVPGSLEIEKGDIDENIMVCGRIAHDQVQGYIKKIKSTTKNPISVIQLFPMTDDDKERFDSLCTYLYSKNRYGVIQTNPSILKDFYIIPILNTGNVPEILKSCFKGPGIDRTEVNCLLGLLIKIKKQPGATVPPIDTPAVYTPTPLS